MLKRLSKLHIKTERFLIYKHQHKLTTARLKKGTAQSFRPANSARIFVNLSWYDIKAVTKV